MKLFSLFRVTVVSCLQYITVVSFGKKVSFSNGVVVSSYECEPVGKEMFERFDVVYGLQ